MKNTRIIFNGICILALILGMTQTLSARAVEQDSLALVALYNSTDGPNWTHNDNWLSGPVASWYGVTVSDERVTGIDLHKNNLVGTIPPEIGDLAELRFLYLYRNRLSGTIPVEIGSLANLKVFDLFQNQIAGSIPVEIGALTQLTKLSLSENKLTGPIPSELGNLVQLQYLYLGMNQLTGPIPPVLFDLPNLAVLRLTSNQFSGVLPLEFERLSNLRILNLAGNQFSDTIKVNFAKLKKLQQLYLSGNDFCGPAPAGLDSLPKLERLSLSSNHFVDLPDLSQDTSLTTLRIGSNRFTFEDIEPNVWVENYTYSPQDSVGEAQDTTIDAGGSLELSVSVGGSANQYQWMKDGEDIPGAEGSSYQINSAGWGDIGVYVCRITNTIATELTLYSRPMHVAVSGVVSPLVQDSLALAALYDSTGGSDWTHNDNWLSGPVSTWYGVTVSDERVTQLDLNHNNLTGAIPPDIGELTALRSLILDGNQLSGVIPFQIRKLVDLTKLSLWGNQLSGAIPMQIGELTQLQTLNLQQNQLTGAIPPEIGALTNLQTLSLYNNQLSGSLPAEMAELALLRNLFLGKNRFSGPIPSVLFDMTNLVYLELNSNEFSGAVPREFERLTKLVKLSLLNNQLSDTIKVNFARLKKLKWLILAHNNFSGPAPAGLDSLPDLLMLNLANNRLADLPDLSPDTSLTVLRIESNRFTFEDIEPNIRVEKFYYSPQDSVGQAQDTTIDVGASLELSVVVGGSANQYQWTKNGVDIPGANSASYTINNAGDGDAGVYVCKITNTIATALTLYSLPVRVSVSGGTLVEDQSATLPTEFALYQNHPNPFNPATVIRYDLPKAAQVEIAVYNLFGQKVRELVDERQTVGEKEVLWDGLDERGQRVASGVYLCRITAGMFSASRKMLLVR